MRCALTMSAFGGIKRTNFFKKKKKKKKYQLYAVRAAHHRRPRRLSDFRPKASKVGRQSNSSFKCAYCLRFRERFFLARRFPGGMGNGLSARVPRRLRVRFYMKGLTCQ